MEDDRIACVKCQRKIVPRLWHRPGSMIRGRTTEHLCPYCGTLQYETGGRLNLFGKLLGLVFILLAAQTGLGLLLQSLGVGQHH